jgi:CBS domain-containing protein
MFRKCLYHIRYADPNQEVSGIGFEFCPFRVQCTKAQGQNIMNDQDKEVSRDRALLQQSDVLYRLSAFQYHETLNNIMESDVFLTGPDASVQKVADEMAQRRISSAVIIDDQARPIGIVTERDIVRKVVAKHDRNGLSRKISEIMTPEPVVLPPDASLFDALSLISRHSIKHLPIVTMDKVVGILTLRKIMKLRYAEPFIIIGQLEEARSVQDYKAIKDELLNLVKEKLDANIDPVDIVTMLSIVNAGIHKRLLKKIIDDSGSAPPAGFCFFVTGSHGRKENLLFPDQDFCVIIDDYEDDNVTEYDRYFHGISSQLSDDLHSVGFPYCPGKVMGQNPDWRKRISEWKTFVSDVFNRQGSYTVRYMTLIFDSAPLYGDLSLFNIYNDLAHEMLTRNHTVLRQMHDEEEGRHKVPLGLFSKFITEKDPSHRGEIDMKRSGLIFIIESSRILALRHGIRETSTIGRIQALVKNGVLQRDDSEYFENAYRVILYHTLHAQVENYLNSSVDSYYLAPAKLSHRNQEMLKEAFKAISNLQDIVRSEFGELVL